jgi:hypothetical protein
MEDQIQLSKKEFQKMVFIMNALNSGWKVQKSEDDFMSDRLTLIIRPSNPNFLPEDVKEDGDIMNMINAGNIIEAVNKINCNADTDDNIFKAITSKLEKEIHNKKAELKYQSERIVDDIKSHEEIIQKLKLLT